MAEPVQFRPVTKYHIPAKKLLSLREEMSLREVLGRVGAGWDVPKYLSSTEGECGVLLTPGCCTLCRWSSAQEPTADHTGGLPEPGADSAEKAGGDSCSSPWESEVGAVWLAGFRARVHVSLSVLLFLETRLYTCVNECMEISRARSS